MASCGCIAFADAINICLYFVKVCLLNVQAHKLTRSRIGASIPRTVTVQYNRPEVLGSEHTSQLGPAFSAVSRMKSTSQLSQ